MKLKGRERPFPLFICSKLKRPDHIVAVSIKEISPPLEHQAALLKMLGCVGISSTDAVAFLMAHLEALQRLLTTNLTQLRHYRLVCGNHERRCPV